jgi:hypothetical protein
VVRERAGGWTLNMVSTMKDAGTNAGGRAEDRPWRLESDCRQTKMQVPFAPKRDQVARHATSQTRLPRGLARLVESNRASRQLQLDTRQALPLSPVLSYAGIAHQVGRGSRRFRSRCSLP